MEVTRLPNPGDVFDGRYEIVGLLGEGGFAVVYEAVDVALGRSVALKVLRPDKGRYARDMRARFDREARLVASLSSPQVARLYASGQSDSGLLFLAFELVPGEDLSTFLGRHGRLEPALVEDLLRQMLAALHEAHAAGLVHRDIKPANIRVFADPLVPGRRKAVLLDFGIARATDSGHPSITRTGELVGTPRYMSPEQLTSRPLGPASDIYSLGVVVFELLVGTQALPAGTWGDQLERLRTGHVFSAPELERIGQPLLAVMQRMTARNATERFPSAAAVLAALDAPAAAPHVETLAHRGEIRLLGGILGAVVVAGVVVIGLAVTRAKEPPIPSLPAKSTTQVNPFSAPEVRIVAPADVGNPAVPADERVSSAGCGGPPPILQGESGLPLLHVPERYDPNVPIPLLIVLHTDFQEPKEWIEDAGFGALADREDILVVAPNGAEQPFGGEAFRRKEKDVDRVRAVWHYVRESYCIDESRVFLLGHGDGARVAIPLSCEDWVAAVSVSSFGFADDGEFPKWFWCDRPVPAIWFHPEDNQHVPNEAGEACSGNRKHGPDKARELWLARNQCGGEPQTSVRRRDGRCDTWACDGAPFEFCTHRGGIPWEGQGVPGVGILSQHLNIDCQGGSSPTFPMTATVWEFFERVGGSAKNSRGGGGDE